MSLKIIVCILLGLIALGLLAVLVVVVKTSKADTMISTVVQNALQLVRVIATALVLIIGGGAALVSLSSCAAKRSITVQGTVIQNQSGDSTRVIISSQESYTGTKK